MKRTKRKREPILRLFSYTNKSYRTICTAAINDKRLSPGAKGIHTQLMCMPYGHSINWGTTLASGNVGEESAEACVDELIDAGYLYKTIKRNDSGTIESGCSIFEKPTAPEEAQDSLDDGYELCPADVVWGQSNDK